VASDRRTSVVYVTARLPFGDGEPFIVPEIIQLGAKGCDLTVVPVRTAGAVADGDALALVPMTACVPLLSLRVLGAALAETVRAPLNVGGALLLLRGSTRPRVLLKNLTVFPKALWLARHARTVGADHIHAHWASTSSTLAMVAGEVSGIPWSFTAHRWDIAENNLLREKARLACFVRVISAHGAEELRGIVGDSSWSPWVHHIGVRLPPKADTPPPARGPLRILTAARFVQKKGHANLLQAVELLAQRGVAVHIELAGDGPLEPELRERVTELGLADAVEFLGRVSHEDLLTDMARGRWDAMALPSIVTRSGELEGIPVSLIEAMACGLPVVGTDAGGVPELLGDGAGLLVPPCDPSALADAIELLARDDALRASLADRGRQRVEEAFSVERIVAALHRRFRECAPGRGSAHQPARP
jgi:colanic acid/amylovoran biosynthesis glycosyltransferase